LLWKYVDDFFHIDDWLFSEDVATIQWRLVRWAGKSGPKEEWQRMAIKVTEYSSPSVENGI